MNFWLKIKEKIKKAPKMPGVYVFYQKKNPLYIGKASNLKNRLQSYVKGLDFKAERLRENATDLKLTPLRSEIEALIEEAKQIKKLNPAYNILWRDDKSYFYASFTGEKFPRIFITHKNLLPTTYPDGEAIEDPRQSRDKLQANSIGPFTEGRALKLVLRMLRRTFPYCTCPKPHLRLCLNAQIGNCPGFCCKKNVKPAHAQVKSYQENIRVIKNFLIGKPLKKFTNNLKPEEREALEKILAHREFLDNFDSEKTYHLPPIPMAKPSRILDKVGTSYKLIEGYDISHLAGREVVAGMTAWERDGETLRPRKEFWRKFIIRNAKPADDPAAIAEAVNRRLNHPEWPYPDVMIIDGGFTQFNAARKIVRKLGVPKKIGVISFAKPGQLVYGLEKNPKELNNAPDEFKKIIPRIVQETHNFAIRFHRERRRKNFLTLP